MVSRVRVCALVILTLVGCSPSNQSMGKPADGAACSGACDLLAGGVDLAGADLSGEVVTPADLAGVDLTGLGDALAAGPPVLTFSGDPYTFNIGVPADSGAPVNSGGAITLCAAGAPALPDGLVVDATNCRISGTPTTVASQSAYPLIVSFLGGTVQKYVTITIVNQPPTLTWAHDPFELPLNQPVSTGVPHNSGGLITSCAATTALPAGLTVDATSCEVHGTPTSLQAAQSYALTIGWPGGTVMQNVNLAVVASTVQPLPPSITIPASSGATWTFQAKGGTAPYQYRIVDGVGAVGGAGLFSAGSAPGATTIEIADAAGNLGYATVNTVRTWVDDGNYITVVRDGNDLYAGGEFTHAHPNWSAGLVALDTTTAAIDRALDAQPSLSSTNVQTILTRASDPFVYVAGFQLSFRGQTLLPLFRMDPTTGAIDPNFTPDPSTLHSPSAMTSGSSSLYVVESTSHCIYQIDLTPGATLGQITAFDACFDTAPSALAVVGTKLYASGDFTSHTHAATSTAVGRIAAVDASTGALVAFTQGAGFDGTASGLAVSADQSRLYVSGSFTTYGGATAKQLVALDLGAANYGKLVSAFAPLAFLHQSAAASIGAPVVTANTLYLAGNFDHYGATAANDVVGIDGTGALTKTFPFDTSYTVISAMASSGSTLYLSGSFTTKGKTVSKVLAADVSGSAATMLPAWNDAAFDYPPWALAFSGSDLIVGGAFKFYGGAHVERIAHFDLTPGASYGQLLSAPDGSQFDGDVSQVAIDRANDSLYLGGYFENFGATLTPSLARFSLSTGDVDTNFPGVDSSVTALQISGDSLYVGGDFTASGDEKTPLACTARILLATHTFDPVWNDGTGCDSGYVTAMGVGNGHVVPAGTFPTWNGVTAPHLAELDTTGAAVPGFTAQPPSGYHKYSSVMPTATGLFVAGWFGGYGATANTAGLFKLDGSGNPDTSVIQGVDNSVTVAVNDADQAIFVFGDFAHYKYSGTSVAAPGLVKIDLTPGATYGQPIAGFPPNSGLNGNPYSATLYDGQLILGGTFTSWEDQPALGIALIDANTAALQP